LKEGILSMIPRPYNLLYIHPCMSMGGASKVLIQLLSGMDRTRFNPIVVLPHNGLVVKEFERINVKTFIFPLNRLSLKSEGMKSIFQFGRTIYYLFKLIKHQKIDLVIGNLFTINQCASFASYLAGIPYIVYPHNIFPGSLYKPWLFNLADTMVACSLANLKNYKSMAKRTQRLELIYNAVDTSDFSTLKDRSLLAKYGIDTETFALGMVGSFQWYKGHDIFINALKRVKERKEGGIHAFLIGDLENYIDKVYFQRLVNLIYDTGLQGVVTFTGFVENMAEVYASIDVLVVPSFGEGFPLVVLEAMAGGVAVIANNVGGISEAVVNGETGILIEPNSRDEINDGFPGTDSLVEAIIRLMDNRELCESYGKNGQIRVRQNFDIKGFVPKNERLYLSVLGNRQNI
jgi:glycosyltransferase involved in cell wall biosynthesis